MATPRRVRMRNPRRSRAPARAECSGCGNPDVRGLYHVKRWTVALTFIDIDCGFRFALGGVYSGEQKKEFKSGAAKGTLPLMRSLFGCLG
jgi:hypothetical protein